MGLLTKATRAELRARLARNQEHAMRFVSLGYHNEKAWNDMPKSEQEAVIATCFGYDAELFQKGHWVEGGVALQSTRTAKTLRVRSGKVIVTDGPFAETKEQLGGAGVLEARDIDHAAQLMSEHPAVRNGSSFEIRPIDDQLLKRSLEAAMGQGKPAAAADAPKAQTKKFASMGYVSESSWEGKSAEEFENMIKDCIRFDEARRREGQWLAGIALQSASTAKTVRAVRGKVVVTDGPFAETKEQLGGIVVLGLQDMDHAVELLSTHPALRFGVAIELRPFDEGVSARWEATLGQGAIAQER
jgi:hypothetical protein